MDFVFNVKKNTFSLKKICCKTYCYSFNRRPRKKKFLRKLAIRFVIFSYYSNYAERIIQAIIKIVKSKLCNCVAFEMKMKK